MKKILTLLVLAAISFSANAAITKWTCRLDSSSEALHNGTAYLLEITDSAKSSSTIESYIYNTGLTGTIDGVKKIASVSFDNRVATRSYEDTFPQEVTNATYCILIVKDGMFAITQDYAITDTDIWAATLNEVSGVTSYQGMYKSQEGEILEIGGGAVPEPTVLALLALGVAGVALRRKKVVA